MGARARTQRVGWQCFLFLSLWRAASDDAIYDPSPLSSFTRKITKAPKMAQPVSLFELKEKSCGVNRTNQTTKIAAFFKPERICPPSCLLSAEMKEKKERMNETFDSCAASSLVLFSSVSSLLNISLMSFLALASHSRILFLFDKSQKLVLRES